MRHLLLITLLLTASLLPQGAIAQNAPADAIVGTWLTTDEDGNRDSVVEILQRDGVYIGIVRWILFARYPVADRMAGQVIVDRENPEPALRERPVLGLEILSGMQYSDGSWSDGLIYSVRTGKHYRARITLVDSDTLKLRGYIGTPFLGSTVRWTRSPIPPPDSAPPR